MASDEDLPDQINKLQIAPVLPPVKLLNIHLPVALNPFFDDNIKLPPAIADSQMNCNHTPIRRRRILPHSCRRCRPRRRSESTLDDEKSSASLATDTTETVHITRSVPRVQKQPLKKTSPSTGSNHKIILREPVLRALQGCFHQNSESQRCFFPKGKAETNQTESQETADKSVTSNGMANYRDLVDECSDLLKRHVDFGQCLGQSTSTRRKINCFSTQSKGKVNASHNSCKKPNNENSAGAGTLPLSTTGSSITNSNLTNTATALESSPPSLRSTTSCSQQAGNSNAAAGCDDVTIDELASYFDTLVHIPKKMSTMAEMMYI